MRAGGEIPRAIVAPEIAGQEAIAISHPVSEGPKGMGLRLAVPVGWRTLSIGEQSATIAWQ